jgi:hypothetical protein
MSEKVSSLRNWLARHKPDIVRCTLRDGQIRELPKPSSQRGQWAQLEHAIVALSPTYLEAMRAGQSEPLAARAMVADDDAESAADDAPPREQVSPLAAMVSALPTVVQLVVDAADASAARHQAAYELAFREQLSLVKLLADRLGGLERAWHAMLLERQQAAAETAGEDALAMSLLGKLTTAANGTAEPPKKEGS